MSYAVYVLDLAMRAQWSLFLLLWLCAKNRAGHFKRLFNLLLIICSHKMTFLMPVPLRSFFPPKKFFKTHRHSNNCFLDYDSVTKMLTFLLLYWLKIIPSALKRWLTFSLPVLVQVNKQLSPILTLEKQQTSKNSQVLPCSSHGATQTTLQKWTISCLQRTYETDTFKWLKQN